MSQIVANYAKGLFLTMTFHNYTEKQKSEDKLGMGLPVYVFLPLSIICSPSRFFFFFGGGGAVYIRPYEQVLTMLKYFCKLTAISRLSFAFHDLHTV